MPPILAARRPYAIGASHARSMRTFRQCFPHLLADGDAGLSAAEHHDARPFTL